MSLKFPYEFIMMNRIFKTVLLSSVKTVSRKPYII